MKLKMKFWALAFALMAVSCSDDIDGDPNSGNNGSDVNGSKAYVRVSINSGTTTKADPTGGEGTGTELGEESEYRVKDVTLVLFQNEGNNVSTDFDFKGTSAIKGVGYAPVTESGQGLVPQHKWHATVQVVIDKKQSANLFNKKFGVIAVTNLGKDNSLYKRILGATEGKSQITTGKALADFIIDYNNYASTQGGFIMSTHTMKYNLTDKANPTESVVEIEEGVSENDAPEVNVFVERIAAKIRISKAENVTDFIYELKDQQNSANTIAKVRLDNVAIVNQLTSGSYLLKRVTAENPDVSTTTEPIYLGDEIWDQSSNKYNYVMDPWFSIRDNKASLPTRSDMKP